MKDTDLVAAIYEHMADGIVIADAKGLILSANKAACLMFGYAGEELYRQPFGILLSASAAPLAMRFCGEVKALQRNGSRFPARLSVSGVMHQGQQYYAAVFCDLSREKETQASDEVHIFLRKESELKRMKHRFIALASHEFRTPLSSIRSSAALIERYYDRLDRTRVFRHLHKIKKSVGGLIAMLEDFLEMEKIDSGKLQPVGQTFDLAQLCGEIVAEMQEQAQAGQTITYRHTGLETNVFLDKDMLRYCLCNLLSNAIKYSGDQGIIDMRSVISAEDWRISVIDHGIGIPVAEQAHLFDVFFRSSNTVNIPGIGLGLHLVKRITERLQGSISFESNEKAGTTFTLCFPPLHH
ncbi:hypothetical protein CKK33_17170 [Mucilaginibacter sp. MD40]|uniref:PAS domain-containing sensor histidine kinase n=1 Tax=Mucilaginibacter sp. MD40 TaxID=2029590 RepID=UPI000BACA064|nr:PAS domain-containing sensor histidine kinase [Mucilaginibacter sp. MD40]PAW95134.1 hypothetical protein CKK33_17170 [Mucilaginibacter sp. MD40]